MRHTGNARSWLGAGCRGAVLAVLALIATWLPSSAAALGRPAIGPHQVIYYYQTLTSLTPILKHLNPATGRPYTTTIQLASFHLGHQSDGTLIHLNDFPPDNPRFATPWRQLAQLQGMGVSVHMMLGGAAPGSYSSLFGDFGTFYPVLTQTIRKHNLTGIDLDVEENVSLRDIEMLIVRLGADFGPDFQITLAPVASDLNGGGGLSGFDYLQLFRDEGSRIAWFNTQFYSGFGSLASTADYDSIVRSGVPPEKVVAGMLGSPNDGGGFVSMKTAAATVHQLAARYPGFAGVFAWEYFDALPGGKKRPDRWSALMAAAM